MLGAGSEGFALLKEVRARVGRRMVSFLNISFSTASLPFKKGDMKMTYELSFFF